MGVTCHAMAGTARQRSCGGNWTAAKGLILSVLVLTTGICGAQQAGPDRKTVAVLRNDAAAESAPLRLDNQGVLRLVQGGLAPRVVVAAIRAAAAAQFDLSPSALESLQHRRVPDVVTAAMLDRQHRDASQAARESVRSDRRAPRQAAVLRKHSVTPVASPAAPPQQLVANAMADLEVVGSDGRIMLRLPALALHQDGQFITTHPEAFEGRAVRLTLANGSVYDSVVLVDRDLRRGVAVVRIKTEGLEVLPRGETNALTSESRLWVWDATEQRLQSAVFQSWTLATESDNPRAGYRLMTMACTGVNEGSPVLNAAGELVGIVQTPGLGVRLQPAPASGTGPESPGAPVLFALPIEDVTPLLHARAGRALPPAPTLALMPVPAPWAGWLDALQRAKTIFVWDRTRAGWGGRAEAEVLRHGPWRIVPDPDEADLWLQLSEFKRGTMHGESLQVYERAHRRLVWSGDALRLPWRRSAARRLAEHLLESIPRTASTKAESGELPVAGRLRAPFPRNGLDQKH